MYVAHQQTPPGAVRGNMHCPSTIKNQVVNELAHCYNHTLDPVLTYAIEIHNLKVFFPPQNPILSDRCSLKLEFCFKSEASW